jgi:predicted amidohydrolase YtcJ
MVERADLIITNAEIHTLTETDETHEAVAIRDGEIVRVGVGYEVEFLEGVETTVIDLAGGVLLPGFIDAHTHMEMVGRYLVHADLSQATSIDEALSLLRDAARDDHEWILGYGYDESAWDEQRYLTRDDLDRVSEEQPVAAFREDMHTGSLNSVALDRHASEMPTSDVQQSDGEPTGVVVEDALDPIHRETAPDYETTRELVTAARDRAHALGVTGVHDMVRNSRAPRVYRDLDSDGDLDLRVRINYWSDHLDALCELGAATNHGSEFVQVGGVKSYSDGSFGGRTAKLTEPYEGESKDIEGKGTETGQWVVGEGLNEIVRQVDDADLQCTVHAIGDAAITAVLDAYDTTNNPDAARHRIEHAELLTDDLIQRFADSGVVASVQPNFLKWAREDGLYEERLGRERTRQTNRYRSLLDAGVPLAFGSDCMPLDPLFGIQQTVTAPTAEQRLTVTEALRAYTSGAAYAGFDENRLGTIEVGKQADLVALDSSPWEVNPERIADIDVMSTIVDGQVVYDDGSIKRQR